MAVDGHLAQRAKVGDDLFGAAAMGKQPELSIGRAASPMPTMVVSVDVETAGRHCLGKTGVSTGVLGKAMTDQKKA
jgi:hypothetical protein